MIVFSFIIFFLLLIVACILCYHFGMHDELHKVRDEIENILRYSTLKEKYVDGLLYMEKILEVMDDDFNGDYNKEHIYDNPEDNKGTTIKE